ncbi:MAG: hypothetical protein AAF705_19940 [Bacteroidota bacterium]
MSTFKEEFDKTINSVKSGLEQLSVQMNLGKKEALEEYAVQKSKLQEWIKGKKPFFDEIKEEATEDLQELKAKYNKLKEKLNATPTSEAEVKAEQEALASTLDDFQDQAEKVEEKSEGATRTFAANLGSQLDGLQTKMRRLSSVIRDEAKEEWQEFREENKENIEKLKAKANEFTEEAKEEWQEFQQEAKSLFKKFRSKF